MIRIDVADEGVQSSWIVSEIVQSPSVREEKLYKPLESVWLVNVIGTPFTVPEQLISQFESGRSPSSCIPLMFTSFHLCPLIIPGGVGGIGMGTLYVPDGP